MPINLLIIICFQIVVFGTVWMIPKTTQIYRIQWIKVAVIGTLYGIGMDFLFGLSGIFAYLPGRAGTTAVAPQNLPTEIFLFNSFASYGLAVATVALVTDCFIRNKKPSKRWTSVTGFTFIGGLICILLSPGASILMMFSWGIALVSFMEMLLLLNNRTGPLVTLLSRNSSLPFLKLWAFSILAGTAYEIANIFFPFWVWLPGSNIPALWLKTLVVLLGYFALFHSMSALWVLFRTQKGNAKK